MLSRTAPPRVDPPPLPHARGPLSAAVLGVLRGEPALRADPADADPYGDDLQLALYCCYELHYRGFAGVPDDREWAPGCSPCAARSSACFEARCARTCRRATARSRRGARARRAARRAHRGPGPVVAPAPRRRALAAARVRRAPLALPPQGGRPAGLGDRPAGRAGEGRAGHRRARRVRRGRPRPHARRALRRHDGELGLSTAYGALPRRGARRDAGRGQLHVAVRAAPPFARSARRAVRHRGADLVPRLGRLVRAMRRLGCAGAGHRASTTSTSRPTPCTSSSSGTG